MRTFAIKFLLLFPVMFFLCTAVNAQVLTLKGRVTDAAGRPVRNASIVLKSNYYRGYGRGTWTGDNGQYTVENILSGDTVICSHVNFNTEKEYFDANKWIDFILSPKTKDVMAVAAKRAVFRPVTSNSNIAQQPKPVNGTQEEARVFNKVEIEAQFRTKSGENLRQYFSSHLILPDTTEAEDYECTVKVHFIVDTKGKAGHAVLIKGATDLVNNAVLRAVDEMPLWSPAMQNGRLVEAEQTVIIKVLIQSSANRQKE